MKKGIKRLLLIALVIGCFFLFDSLMDYTAHYFVPSLFSMVLYPVDVAGVIEYTVAFGVLFGSYKKGVEWLSTGTFAAFVFTLVIIGQKLFLGV
jgi:hypothetical protein